MAVPLFAEPAMAQTPRCTLRPDDQALSASFDDPASPTADLEPFLFTSTAFGTPASVPGRSGQALQFDGVDDYLEVNDSLISWRPFTIAAWVSADANAPWMNVIADNRNTSTGEGIQLALFQGQPLLQYADSNGWTNHWVPELRIADGQWHHVAVTVDRVSPDGIRFFVDGRLVRTFDPGVKPDAEQRPTNLLIGRSQAVVLSQPRFFQGYLDEVQVFSRALPESEIAQMVAAGENLCNSYAKNLQSARALWDSSRPNLKSYFFTEDDRRRGGEVSLIDVNGNTVVSTNLETGEKFGPTQVDDVMQWRFQDVERAIAQRHHVIRVKYDPTYGFPADAYLSRARFSNDTHISFELRDFTVRTAAPRSCWKSCTDFRNYAQSFCAGLGTSVNGASVSCTGWQAIFRVGRGSGACVLTPNRILPSFAGKVMPFCSE